MSEKKKDTIDEILEIMENEEDYIEEELEIVQEEDFEPEHEKPPLSEYLLMLFIIAIAGAIVALGINVGIFQRRIVIATQAEYYNVIDLVPIEEVPNFKFNEKGRYDEETLLLIEARLIKAKTSVIPVRDELVSGENRIAKILFLRNRNQMIENVNQKLLAVEAELSKIEIIKEESSRLAALYEEQNTPVEEPAEEPIEEPAEEPIEEPVEEITDKEAQKLIDQLAYEVYMGTYDNGSSRVQKLKDAGYDFQVIQDRVNEKYYGIKK